MRCHHVNFIYSHITHYASELCLCCVVWIIIMAIHHNRIFMLWHVVVTNQLFSHVIVAYCYCFLLRVVFCFVFFFLTCLVVPFGVCVTPISPDCWYFWRFCWFCPPSHLWMGHFVLARHTFLCIVTARHGNITCICTYHVLLICYFCNAATAVAARWQRWRGDHIISAAAAAGWRRQQ
jgi:hypothetical protein